MASENRLPLNNLFGGWGPAGNWDSTLHNHAASQPYAWDVGYSHGSDPDGTSFGKVHAARAGVVLNVINDVPGPDPQPAWFTPAYQVTPHTPPTPSNPSGGHQSARGGNTVVIRHADGTAFGYCHMRTGSIVVTPGQYVNRGALLGIVGNTGASSGPHMHFDRVAWADPPLYTTSPTPPNVSRNLDINQGGSIISHFEGWSGTLFPTVHSEPWRLVGNETTPYNVIELAQDGWRFCYKCGSLYYKSVFTGSGVCKAGGAHDMASWTNYTLFCDSSSPGQADWKWCSKCSMLFYSLLPSKCPVTTPTNAHDGGSSQPYRINNGPSAPGEHGWRWCSKCQSLWSTGATTTKCPADGLSHLQSGSPTDYALRAHSDDIQTGWRSCSKCKGVFIAVGGGSGGVCPSGGAHAADLKYTLFHSISPLNATGGGQNSTWQENWAWCGNCCALYFRPWESSSKCPVGPTFKHTGIYSSTNYILLYQTASIGDTDTNWKWCSKCQGLVRGTSVGKCPADGLTHAGAGNYALPQDYPHF